MNSLSAPTAILLLDATVVAKLCHRVSASNRRIATNRRSCVLILHLTHQLCENILTTAAKHLFDGLTRLCGCFEALVNAISLGPFDCPVKSDLTLIVKFRLIADQIDHDVFGGVLFDFLVPLGQIIKSLVASDIVS